MFGGHWSHGHKGAKDEVKRPEVKQTIATNKKQKIQTIIIELKIAPQYSGSLMS